MRKFSLIALVATLFLSGCYMPGASFTNNMRDVNATADIDTTLNASTSVAVDQSKNSGTAATPAPSTTTKDPDYRAKFYPGGLAGKARRGWNVSYDPGTGQIIQVELPGNLPSDAVYIINPLVPDDIRETLHLNKYMVWRGAIVYNISEE